MLGFVVRRNSAHTKAIAKKKKFAGKQILSEQRRNFGGIQVRKTEQEPNPDLNDTKVNLAVVETMSKIDGIGGAGRREREMLVK